MKPAELLREGLDKIQSVGWYRGDNAGREVVTVGSAGCECIATSVHQKDEALFYIRMALGLHRSEMDFLTRDELNEIYRANDSQPGDETGRRWAVNTLRTAITLADRDELMRP